MGLPLIAILNGTIREFVYKDTMGELLAHQLSSMFEFLFGHYVMGHSCEILFAEYNVFEGGFWSIVAFLTAAAHLIVHRVRE